MLLAHDAHIQKQAVVWGDYLFAHPMGLYLHRALGDAYRALGSTTTGGVTSEMKLEETAGVGFVVVSVPRFTVPGSFEAALVDSGFAGA